MDYLVYAYLQRDRQQPRPILARVGALGQETGQRPALHQLHGEERAFAEGADVVDRDDAGVLQLAADLRLLDEAAHHVDIIAEFFAENLQSDVAAQVRVATFQHGTHPAPRDLTVDTVTRAAA